MSTERPGEDRQFDTAIDRAWREASNEGPAPHVDAAILAAARSRRRSISTWQPLAAVAMVAGLAFLLVQLMPTAREAPPPVRIERAAPGESKAAPAQQDVASQESPTRQEPGRAREAQSPAEAGTLDAPTHAGPASNEIAADMAVAPAAPAASAAPTAGLHKSAGADVVSRLAPQSWAARVAALHRTGDLEAAAADLRAFRAAYPDADRFLPDELRAWADHIE